MHVFSDTGTPILLNTSNTNGLVLVIVIASTTDIAKKYDFELHLALVSSQPWVHCPQHLVMWNGGKCMGLRSLPLAVCAPLHVFCVCVWVGVYV